jgi:hypothetical protein
MRLAGFRNPTRNGRPLHRVHGSPQPLFDALGGIAVPVHDWTRVKPGIFHHFHHRWISEISDSLNAGLLPADYYALAEQFAGGFGPDVLTLQEMGRFESATPSNNGGQVGVLVAPPQVAIAGESDMEFYERKQKVVTVRHVSDDRVVAVVEIVSPGNKSGRRAFQAFVDKACDLIHRQIQLLIVDLLPPGPRDPQGVHAAIWEDFTGDDSYRLPQDKPLTLAAYESGLGVRAYVEHFAVGDSLVEMPLFLYAGGHVPLELDATYRSAFRAVPRRRRTVLEPGEASQPFS